MLVSLFITLTKCSTFSPSIFIAVFKQVLIWRGVFKKLPGKIKIWTKLLRKLQVDETSDEIKSKN